MSLSPNCLLSPNYPKIEIFGRFLKNGVYDLGTFAYLSR